MSRPKGTKNKVLHIWTDEEKEYLKEIAPGHHYKEIQELMIDKFNYDFTMEQIKGALRRYKLNTGFTGRFNKGHAPANKGLKGVCGKGCEKTWFKEGTIPPNHRPVGSERTNVDGYIEIKIAEPNKWRLKHQVIWEKHNGKILSGYAVIFGDGDKTNLDIDNLILISRKQLLTMNRYKLIQNDAELTKTGVIIASLHEKIKERGKENKKNADTM